MSLRWVSIILCLVVAIAMCASEAHAVTLSTPVYGGDVFAVHYAATNLYQFRNQAKVSDIPLTGAWGVMTDSAGNLWFTQGDGGANPFVIETIPVGQTASVVKLNSATINAPTGATEMRDIAMDSSGNLYASFNTSDAKVMKYTPDGLGGFNTGTLVGGFGNAANDKGGAHLNLSADQAYLLTGNWGSGQLYSLKLSTGTVQSFGPDTQPANQCLVDPNRPNVLIYGSKLGMRELNFNTATGAISGSTIKLSNDPRTVSDFCDASTFTSANRLYFEERVGSNEIRYATEPQLVAAAAGTPFQVSTLPLVYQGAEVYATRDIAVSSPPGPTITLSSPVTAGDIMLVDSGLRRVYQIRGSSAISTVDFGADLRVGGVYTDGGGNVYIASGPVGMASVDRIAYGQTTNTQVLHAEEIVGTAQLRDCAVAPDGTVYVSYADTAGTVAKFTPGPAGYTRSVLGTFGLDAVTDRGNGHILLTRDGRYLVTCSRTSNRLAAMDTATGPSSLWVPSGVSYTLVGEVALDPINNDYLVFGAAAGTPGQLYGLPFNPATGTFGATATLLNTDGDLWIDALGFDPSGSRLYLCARDNKMYIASAELLAAAKSGTPFTIRNLPFLYQGAGAYVARDMAIVIPEPATALVLGGAVLALARWNRRRARKQE